MHDIRSGVGRPKQYSERITVPLPEGASAWLDAALVDDEDRLDLIRDAIEREMKRRKQPKFDVHAKPTRREKATERKPVPSRPSPKR